MSRTSRVHIRWSLILAVSVIALAIMSFPAAQDGKAGTGCKPSFPYKDGWLGGDAAYSVLLPDGRSLWLFGDSFVGDTSETKRSRAKEMVRNSIALSSCDPVQGWRIQYHWRTPHQGNPKAFFDPKTEEYWYWPGDGFVRHGKAYIVLRIVKDKPGEKLFGFQYMGARLAVLSNLSELPERWKVEYLDVIERGGGDPGATVVCDGDYVYVFSLFDDKPRRRRPMVLARIPLDALDSPAVSLEYFAHDKNWEAGFEPAEAFPVLEQGASEMTVRYHRELRKWVAVALEPKFLSNKIVVSLSSELTGPWTAWQTIHVIPEMLPTSPDYDPDTWCYAGKEHVEFSRPGNLLITYVCNSFKFKKLVSNMSIYRPQVVVAPFPNRLD